MNRLLELANDSDTPLLERVRFVVYLMCFLDEFISLRLHTDPVLLTPLVNHLQQGALDLFIDKLYPKLQKEGISIVKWSDVRTSEQKKVIDEYCPSLHCEPIENIIGNRIPSRDSCYFVVSSSHIVFIPDDVNSLIKLSSHRFISIQEVVRHCKDWFGSPEHTYAGRVVICQNCEEENSTETDRPVIRLEVQDETPDALLHRLCAMFCVENASRINDVFFALGGLKTIYNLDHPNLKYAAFQPREVIIGKRENLFESLRFHERMLHHPFDCFQSSVEVLLLAASSDPRVTRIRQTLYRVEKKKPIINLLERAAQNGKTVEVLIETRVRGSELANQKWAEDMNAAGVRILRCHPELKTHAKMMLIDRYDDDGERRQYCHISTGNYHRANSTTYDDFAILSGDQNLCNEVSQVFDFLSGSGSNFTENVMGFHRLWVSPFSIREQLLQQIRRETEMGTNGLIRLKCNTLLDETVKAALMNAVHSGVHVQILVRNMCTLLPSSHFPNLTVKSILGRFLEHSRIFLFGRDRPQVWIGSADLMSRNLDRRVEVAVKVEDPEHIAHISDYLSTAFDANTDGWILSANGSWTRIRGIRHLHDWMIKKYKSGRHLHHHPRDKIWECPSSGL
jgi:polyphosphate kinase